MSILFSIVAVPVYSPANSLYCCCSVTKSCPVLWRPHGLQHARLPCPSLSPRVCSNLCPLSRCFYPTISSSASFSFCLESCPASGSLQWIDSSYQVAKFWNLSFSISPSNENSGLISFRTDWFDLLGFQGTLKSSPVLHLIALSLVYGPTFTSVHDYWKDLSFDYTDLCGQSDVFVF